MVECEWAERYAGRVKRARRATKNGTDGQDEGGVDDDRVPVNAAGDKGKLIWGYCMPRSSSE